MLLPEVWQQYIAYVLVFLVFLHSIMRRTGL
jgi:hypothetical protein